MEVKTDEQHCEQFWRKDDQAVCATRQERFFHAHWRPWGGELPPVYSGRCKHHFHMHLLPGSPPSSCPSQENETGEIQ
jgi:hypothetical protein